MNEISETEIKAMTKEQNYMRGYKDGKSDVLDQIRVEIELKEKTLTDKYGQQKYGVWTDDVLQIIDKYKADKKDKE